MCKRFALSYVGIWTIPNQKDNENKLAPILCIRLYNISAWAVVVTSDMAVQSHRRSNAIVPTPCYVKLTTPFWESEATINQNEFWKFTGCDFDCFNLILSS